MGLMFILSNQKFSQCLCCPARSLMGLIILHRFNSLEFFNFSSLDQLDVLLEFELLNQFSIRRFYSNQILSKIQVSAGLMILESFFNSNKVYLPVINDV